MIMKKDVEKRNINSNQRFVRVHFNLSADIYKQVSLMCFLEELSLSDFMRNCVIKELKEFKENPEFKIIFEKICKTNN